MAPKFFTYAIATVFLMMGDVRIACGRENTHAADDYALGRGVAQDDDKAIALYRKAAGQGDVSAQGKLGAMIANCRGSHCDDDAAAALLKRAADAGDASAQFNLAVMYADGRGVPEDQELSLQWRTRAADQGLAVAMRDLGDLLMSAWKRDEQNRGLSYYEKLADRGDADAAYQAGHFLASRSYCGLAQRDEYVRRAVPLLEKAATHSDARASLDLARIHEQPTSPVFNEQKSRAWYEKASADGSSEASYHLGVTASGDQVALGFYLKAVKAGDANAAQALSNLYVDPHRGVFNLAASRFWFAEYSRLLHRQNKPTKTFEDYKRTQRVILDANQTYDWYRRAAARGNAIAAYNLGIMYLGGLGVDVNDVEAKTWLSKASLRGVGNADAVLGDIYISEQREKAIASYEKAARRGIVRAQVKLGEELRLDGFRWSLAAARRGSAPGARQVGEAYAEDESCGKLGRQPACDPKLAMKWFRIAADRGDVAAQFSVADLTAGSSGLDPKINPAVALYLRASDNGSAEAAKMLGRIYRYGHEAGDQRKALKFFLLAAQRDERVEGAVAELYEALNEPQQALDWYRKAGNTVKVGGFYEGGLGVTKDVAKAHDWYLKGAQDGLPAAQYRLGRLYADGTGGSANAPLAYELFMLSSMGGSKAAASTGIDSCSPRMLASPERRSFHV